jgi:RNA recognition motif-containing protein
LAKTLYVGNLPYSSNESSLAGAFSAYGARNCRIIEGRGFGFVDIDDDQLDSAISAMNGKEMDGRTLTVNEARPKGESGGGGSFGGQRSSGNGGYGGGGRKRGW